MVRGKVGRWLAPPVTRRSQARGTDDCACTERQARRMSSRNRLEGDAALKTSDMWSAVIGGAASGITSEQASNVMLLAKASSAANAGSSGVIRGGCKRCGLLGHLSFQCRNVPQAQKAEASADSDSDSDSDSSSDNGDPSRLVPPLSAKEKAPPVSDKNKRKRDDDDLEREEKRERRRLKKEKKVAKKKDKKNAKAEKRAQKDAVKQGRTEKKAQKKARTEK